MLFNEGTYVHESGLKIVVTKDEVFTSRDAPLSMRLSEIFNMDAWKEEKKDNGDSK